MTQLRSQTGLFEYVLRVASTHPGEVQWSQPEALWYPPSPVQERTRNAALQAARRIDPQATGSQITRTEWSAFVQYVLGPSNHRYAVCSVMITPHGEMY